MKCSEKECPNEYQSLLGSTVTVTVDRAIGSYHPEHRELYYPVNYGYLDGIISGDGEEIDAYILGVDKPIKEFVGRVIAIIYRKNDVENKLVVAPEDCEFTKEQIIALTDFQERYFDITVET